MSIREEFLNELMNKFREAEAVYPPSYEFPFEYYSEDDKLAICFKYKKERVVMIFGLNKIVVEV